MLNWIILLCLFSVVSIIFKIIGQRKCVSEATLRRFMAQRLRTGEKDHVIAHLGICEKCQQKLEEISFGKKKQKH